MTSNPILSRLVTIFRRSLLNKKRYLGANNNGQPIESIRDQWVVARGDCLYRAEDLTAIGEKSRVQVLQQRIKQWAPFADFAYHISWQAGWAMVWLWRTSKVGNADAEQYDIFPETVLYPKVHTGIVFKQVLQGLEGQCWQAGVLRHSQWWPAPPSEQEQKAFIRLSAGEQLSVQRLELAHGQMADLPWGQTAWSFLWQPKMLEKLLPGLCMVLLAAALGINIARLAVAWGGTQWLESRYDSEQTLLAEVLNVRREAQTLQSKNEVLQQAVQLSQLALFDLVLQALPASVDELTRWHFQGDRLDLSIKTTKNGMLDIEQLVKQLEAVSNFSEIRIKSSPRRQGNWDIAMKVLL